METLLEADRDLATLLFGARRDRPTVSRRVGELISGTTGMSAKTGTDLFHLLLVVGGFSLLTKNLK